MAKNVVVKKWEYWKVLQQYVSDMWNDVEYFECDSRGSYKTKEESKRAKDAHKDYKENQNYPLRFIFRKEKVD
jgi:hypothetical protein